MMRNLSAKPNRIKRRALPLTAICLALATALSGCFTGVESTPVISGKDVKRQRASTLSAEQSYLADIRPAAPSLWAPGKRFIVTDSRIGIVLDVSTDAISGTRRTPTPGDTLRLVAAAPTPTLTEQPEMTLTFIGAHGDSLAYHTGIDERNWKSRQSIEIPFTIDADLIDSVARRLVGKHLYIIAQRRMSWPDGNIIAPRRYVGVTVRNVRGGTAELPVIVVIEPDDAPGTLQAVYMTLGDGATATRNFDKVFALENPRSRYPQIEDDVWQLICDGKIRLGMTPDECRLSLGAPTEYLKIPSTSGMVERWTYPDGVYLIFEDGVLARYRR